MMERESAKIRLITAATDRFYRQGIQRTSLADIAKVAEVPLGNVYYHFKTKESLIQAVIATYRDDLQKLFALLEHNSDPRKRLIDFVRSTKQHAPQMAQFGCPHGSLCQELAKEPAALVIRAAELLQCYVGWVTAQFTLLGKNDAAATDAAMALIAQLQGTYLLASTLRDADLLQRQLEQTIDLFLAAT